MLQATFDFHEGLDEDVFPNKCGWPIFQGDFRLDFDALGAAASTATAAAVAQNPMLASGHHHHPPADELSSHPSHPCHVLFDQFMTMPRALTVVWGLCSMSSFHSAVIDYLNIQMLLIPSLMVGFCHFID